MNWLCASKIYSGSVTSAGGTQWTSKWWTIISDKRFLLGINSIPHVDKSAPQLLTKTEVGWQSAEKNKKMLHMWYWNSPDPTATQVTNIDKLPFPINYCFSRLFHHLPPHSLSKFHLKNCYFAIRQLETWLLAELETFCFTSFHHQNSAELSDFWQRLILNLRIIHKHWTFGKKSFDDWVSSKKEILKQTEIQVTTNLTQAGARPSMFVNHSLDFTFPYQSKVCGSWMIYRTGVRLKLSQRFIY